MGSAPLRVHALRVEKCHSNAFSTTSFRTRDENTVYRRKFKLLHALQDPKAFLLSSRGDFQARSMFIPPFTGQRWLLSPAPWNFYHRLPDTSVKDRQVALLARIPWTLLRFERFQTTVDWSFASMRFERTVFVKEEGLFYSLDRWWFLFTDDKEWRCPNIRYWC